MAEKLTDTKIKACRAQTKPYKIFDGKGLYLLITPSGIKLWRLKYFFAGKEKLYSLGNYPDLSLAKAREEAEVARKLVKSGVDPVAHRKTEQVEAQEAAANTFEKLALEFIGNQGGRWSARHRAAVLLSLKKNVFPSIGRRPVNAIQPPEILSVIRSIERRDALATASIVLQRIGAVFRYAIQSGRAIHNPAGDMRGALRTRKERHQAALSEKDLQHFLRALDKYDGDQQTKTALSILVYTFTRTNEVRGAEWGEFDLDAGMWRIPAERMKTRTPHVIPLSRQVVAYLRGHEKLTGGFRLVFPHRSDGMKPMGEHTLLNALYQLGYRSRATVHGFRATASTILNEQGWNADVIERQLAHQERNKVRRAYHRSEYIEDRRRLLQHWADYLDARREGAQVVNIKSRERKSSS